MATPFIGDVRMFGGNFAPVGHAFCDGALQSIAQNNALFALIGTTYGGDGQQTFALPDLRGRLPIHQGQGPGLSNYVIGQSGGSETVTLTSAQVPAHAHSALASAAAGNTVNPAGKVWAGDPSGDVAPYQSGAANANMAATALSPGANAQPHNNVQPYLCISFIIALEGIFPSRN